jgi:hypothetical protein
MHRIVDRETREKTAPLRFGTNIALDEVKFSSAFDPIDQTVFIKQIHVLVQLGHGSLEMVAIPLEGEDFVFNPPHAPRAKRIEWTHPHYYRAFVRGFPITVEFRLFGQILIQTKQMVVQCDAKAERAQGEYAYVIPIGFELHVK